MVKSIKGERVESFFDDLLLDSAQIRKGLRTRFRTMQAK
jgi:hypothetical protein